MQTLHFAYSIHPPRAFCSDVFASSSAALLGGYTQVYTDWAASPSTLTIWLDYSASISVGDLITLTTSNAIVSRIERVSANAGSVTVQVRVVVV